MDLTSLNNLFKAELWEARQADYVEFLCGFGVTVEELANEFSLGVADKNFTKHFDKRSSSKGRQQREYVRDLGITGNKGSVIKVGLTFPLFSPSGEVVNIVFYRLRGNGGSKDRTSDLGSGGMIWKTEAKEVVLVDHPLDLLALKACGYDNGVYAADLGCEEFRAKLAKVEKVTLLHNELPEIENLSVHRVQVERLGGGFLWERLKGNPHAAKELESFLLVAPIVSGEVEKVVKKELEWRKQGGFYFVDLEKRTYRIGGIDSNRSNSKLKSRCGSLMRRSAAILIR